MSKLTDKQKKFCREYVIDFNGTQAAIRSGYSKKTSNEQAARMLAKVSISEHIKILLDKNQEKAEVTAQMLTDEWKKIAFSSIAHLHNTWIELKDFNSLTEEQKSCIESIDTKSVIVGEDKEVQQIQIKLYPKTKALEELGKHVGYYEKNNNQKQPLIDLGGESTSELIKRVEAIREINKSKEK